MRMLLTFAAAIGFLALWTLANVASAANITLDGTSGSNVDSGAYSTTGDLNVSLGFFVEHLIVAGGGGGGRWGGGGAGGLITGTAERSNLNYPISVGAGGTGVNGLSPGGNGGDSTAFGLTAVGGGGGAEFNAAGQNGGSGGGGGATDTAGAKLGGTGTAGQGNAGGSATMQGGNPFPGGGGGGAGSAGGSTVGSVAGNGGAGLSSSITGTALFYAGGGGGPVGNGTVGTGGSGVGGNGGKSGAPTVQSTAGMDGRGGGGGGASNLAGYTAGQNRGGSGIVIARYLGAPAGTGGTVSAGTGSATGYTLHTFDSVGADDFDLSGLDLDARLGVTLTTAITGTGDLNFNGPGRLTLAADNSYGGATNVNAGTLLINGNQLAAPGLVTVAPGATLGGNGIIGGNTVIRGTHSPDNSPDTQTFLGNLTYEDGGDPDPLVLWELIDNTTSSPGTNFDTIVVGGDLTFADLTTLELDFNNASAVLWSDPFWDVSHTGIGGWLLYDVDSFGAITGFPANLSINATDWLDSNAVGFNTARPGSSFSLFYDATGNDIYLNYNLAAEVIPEPSTYALALLGLLGLGCAALRKKHRAG